MLYIPKRRNQIGALPSASDAFEFGAEILTFHIEWRILHFQHAPKCSVPDGLEYVRFYYGTG